MARSTGPKNKLSRREGVNLTGTRSRSLERRLDQPPGVHAQKRRKRISEYGHQLREKQKLKRHFGMTEKQFRRTFEDALRASEPTGDAFLTQLEQRLDNVVYRVGFTSTRPAARQLVSHGHVRVNGRRVNIPSYKVSPGDTIAMSERAAEIPDVQEALSDAGRQIPSWLSRDGTRPEARVVALPNPDEFDMQIDLEPIIAFYAR